MFENKCGLSFNQAIRFALIKQFNQFKDTLKDFGNFKNKQKGVGGNVF